MREGIVAFEEGAAANLDPATLSVLARNVAYTSVLREDYREAQRWYRESAEIAERAELHAQMLEVLVSGMQALALAEQTNAAYRFSRGAVEVFAVLAATDEAPRDEDITRAVQAHTVAAVLALARASGRSARRYAEAGIAIFEDGQRQPSADYVYLSRIAGIMATVDGEPDLAWRRFVAAERIQLRIDPQSDAVRELSAWRAYSEYFISEARQNEILQDLVARNVLEENDVCSGEDCPEIDLNVERCGEGDYVAPESIGERQTPNYPAMAAAAGAGGFVLVDYGVDAQGGMTDIVPVAFVPRDLFNRSVTRAMQRWRHTRRPVTVSPLRRRG